MVRRQMRGRLVGWLLALLVLALAPLPARADTTEEVKHHYAEGLKRYNLGEYAKALDEFKAAYLGKPDPAFLFNIGQCQRQLAQFEDAARSYRAFLREGADLTKAQRDQVQRLIADMDTAATTGTALAQLDLDRSRRRCSCREPCRSAMAVASALSGPLHSDP